MATNCYEYEIPVTVCVDGPVGGGDTATLSVYLPSAATVFFTSPAAIASNWDGSPVVFENFITFVDSSCDWDSSRLTVTLVGSDEVEVIIELRAFGCHNTGGIYIACGDEGPHTFTDTKIVPMTGTPCPS